MSYIDLIDELRAANEAIEGLDNYLMDFLTLTAGGIQCNGDNIQHYGGVATYLCNVAMFDGPAPDINNAKIDELKDYICKGIRMLIPTHRVAAAWPNRTILSGFGPPKNSMIAKIIEKSQFPYTIEKNHITPYHDDRSIRPVYTTKEPVKDGYSKYWYTNQALITLYDELRERQRELDTLLYSSIAANVSKPIQQDNARLSTRPPSRYAFTFPTMRQSDQPSAPSISTPPAYTETTNTNSDIKNPIRFATANINTASENATEHMSPIEILRMQLIDMINATFIAA